MNLEELENSRLTKEKMIAKQLKELEQNQNLIASRQLTNEKDWKEIISILNIRSRELLNLTQEQKHLLEAQSQITEDLKDNIIKKLENRLIYSSKINIIAFWSCLSFGILLIFFTYWLYNLSESSKQIEENNTILIQVINGNKKFWFDEKNRQIYLKNIKKKQDKN